ncbi:MAG TPA: diguanylate cyclase [Egibacteraceae bacterium]|nr:diguanylate cyclase [Egibacteraceae bacterium]
MDIVEVGGIVAARPTEEHLDDVLVTDPHGGLIGVVTLRDIIWRLTEERTAGEEDLNPLSGLLGSAWVEQELARRGEAGAATTVMMMDIDGFHTINDLGGFPLGDDLIRAMGRCLSGVAGDFRDGAAAHIGGDDFILLVHPRDAREMAAELVRSFEAEIMPFLRNELRLRAAEEAVADVALSLAAIDACTGLPPGYRHLQWVNERVAEFMRMAKSHDGYCSVHAHDRDILIRVWSPGAGGQRTVSLGLAEPSLVLGALDLIDDAFGEWWRRAEEDGGALGHFPGPEEVVQRLRSDFLLPLRDQADRSVAERVAVMSVTLQGDEAQMLELLDRVALVTARASASKKMPLPPELALLGRLLRQRSRSMARRDLEMAQVS